MDFLKNLLVLRKKDRRIRYLTAVALFFVIALVAELFVFNIRHWQTISNKPYEPELVFDNGYALNEDGSYTITSDNRFILLPNLSGKLKTIYTKIQYVGEDKADTPSQIYTNYDARDTSHYSIYTLNTRPLYPTEEKSFYVTLHLYGDVKEFRLHPFAEIGRQIEIKIICNPVIPIFFSFIRVMIVFLGCCFVYFLMPASILHKVRYLKISKRARIRMLAGFFVVNAIILVWANGLNTQYHDEYSVNNKQYHELAEAFAQGSVSLLDEPDERLKTMENPYDMSLRATFMPFEDYKFDHAYYNGKYYVYFGVVPEVLVYFPYYLITGKHIHNRMVDCIGSLLILLGFIMLLDETIKKYYRKCSLGVWFLTLELILMGSYLIYVTKRPDLYAVPMVYGVMFSVWGMWAFIRALGKDRPEKKLDWKFMMIGSICTALVIGCRPQLFVVVIADALLFWDYLKSLTYLRSRNGLQAIAAVGIPMAVIGGLLMLYNAARFGSPFDFGAFYNLTFNDMRYRGFVFDRIPIGLATYLLRPVEFVPQFPYFGNINLSTMYMGETIWETTYGGIFAASPFSIFGLFSIILLKKLKKRSKLWIFSLSVFVSGMIVVIFDTVNSGILARYFFDFSYLLLFASGLTLFNILSDSKIKKSPTYTLILWILVVLLLYGFLYNMLTFMLDSGDYMMTNQRKLFYKLYYTFGFLM